LPWGRVFFKKKKMRVLPKEHTLGEGLKKKARRMQCIFCQWAKKPHKQPYIKPIYIYIYGLGGWCRGNLKGCGAAAFFFCEATNPYIYIYIWVASQEAFAGHEKPHFCKKMHCIFLFFKKTAERSASKNVQKILNKKKK
jgi:hypothetical protein